MGRKPKRPVAKQVPRSQSLAGGKSPQSLTEQVVEGVADAESILGSAPVPYELEPDEIPSPDELAELWRTVMGIRRDYEAGLKQLDERERQVAAGEIGLAERRSKLDGDETMLATQRVRLSGEEAELAVGRDALQVRIAELDERDQRLLENELSLTAAKEREKESILAEARAELAAVSTRVAAAREQFDEELNRQRERLRHELAGERELLDNANAALAQERQELRQWENRLRAQAEDLRDTKDMYNERTALAVEAATAQVRADADHFRRLYEAARSDADRYSEHLVEFDRLRRAFDNRDPQEVRNELEALRAETLELRRLRLTNFDDTALRMAAIEEEARRLRERCTIYAADNERLQRQLSAHEITATSLERVSLTKEAMEAEVAAYRKILEEQHQDWKQLVERKESTSAFPACSKMDQQFGDLRDDLADEAPPLDELLDRVRAIIQQQHRLYYEHRDLRSFLGGLAATQLHLLQGMSGIGKTQLPQRFAEAIGAPSAVVSVGADWRTPLDLMGYYNAFERRFYESEFTKALYKAQCPGYADQPFFLVLDEMNLSHPEQYFNDVLSALERERSRTRIPDLVLMTSAIEPSPLRLREGRLLPVPKSVYFVGTANHDETTVSFADKTYDRAHVMELPPHPLEFTAPPQDPLQPLSFAALENAFDAAVQTHPTEAEAARTFLSTTLAERMATEFRIGWGRRLQRYADRYVPVVTAAGGTLSEATDHLVATQILRKLRGRYEIRIDPVKRFRDELPALWTKLSTEGQLGPAQSLAVMDSVIRDLGHG